MNLLNFIIVLNIFLFIFLDGLGSFIPLIPISLCASKVHVVIKQILISNPFLGLISLSLKRLKDSPFKPKIIFHFTSSPNVPDSTCDRRDESATRT